MPRLVFIAQQLEYPIVIWQIQQLIAGSALALAACTTVVGGNERMINDGQTFSINAGEQVMLADHSLLRYVRVVADSRCPPGAQCIRAGDAELALQWTPQGSSAQDFSLKTPPPEQPQSRDLGTRRLTLLSLARGDAPQAQLKIERIN